MGLSGDEAGHAKSADAEEVTSERSLADLNEGEER